MKKERKPFSRFAIIAIFISAIAAVFPAQISKSESNTGNDPVKAINLTDADFNKTIKEGITLVDFWATWCGPCRIQGPIVDQVAADLGDKAVIAKLDVDKNRATSGKYSVTSIPTIIIFKNGIPVKRFVGVQQKQTLINAINSFL
ncbi:MAG: thioredoxin [Saprospiraceae bacterium]|nr:thioredoxin [Saprospiraceae bacterium]